MNPSVKPRPRLERPLSRNRSTHVAPAGAKGEAAEALGEVKADTGPVVKALVKALAGDRSFWVKRHCVWALEKIEDTSPPVLAALERTAYTGGSNESGDAIRCLGKFANSSEEALDLLLKMLGSSETEQVATYALADIGRDSPKTRQAMKRNLSSANQYVREAAAKYFLGHPAAAAEAKEELIRLLRNRESHGVAAETLEALGVNVAEELKKLGHPLHFFSAVRGILRGWLALDSRLSLARNSFLARAWAVPVAALLLGLVGYLLPKFTAKPIVLSVSLAVAAAVGMLLCLSVSRAPEGANWVWLLLGVFFIGLAFISIIALKPFRGSPLYLLAALSTIPIFFAVDLSQQASRYFWLLRYITENICPNCGRLTRDASVESLGIRDTDLGGGRIVREHIPTRVERGRVCPGCSFRLGPQELSPIELYQRAAKRKPASGGAKPPLQ